jgi:hypothetical protein
MDRKKKIAYHFFELKKNTYDNLINKQLKLSGENSKVVFPARFILDFKFLFGVKNTLEYFLDWIVNSKNFNIPEKTTFVFRDQVWLRKQGISWSEICSNKSVGMPIVRFFNGGKLCESNNVEEIEYEYIVELKMEIKE